METFFDSIRDIVAVVLIFGLPVIAVVMGVLAGMNKRKREKEIRQLIIENHTDPETAKLILGAPKKPKRELGPVNLDTLRTASILLGVGLGAFIYWGLEHCGFGDLGMIELGLLIAFGIGIGLLCSFLVEMRLFKKYGKQLTNPSAPEPAEPAPAEPTDK